MSISSKARRAATGINHPVSQTISSSTTLVVVNPTVRRLRSVVSELSTFVMAEGDFKQQRMQRLLNIVTDEAIEELSSIPESSVALWMTNMARVIQWAATGDLSILPVEMLPFACQVEGIDYNEFMRANMPDEDEEDIPEAELLEIER